MIPPPPPPSNPHPPGTWQNAGMCAKCGAMDSIQYERHYLRWEPSPRYGTDGGNLMASCWRCGHKWRVKARDE